MVVLTDQLDQDDKVVRYGHYSAAEELSHKYTTERPWTCCTAAGEGSLALQ